MLIKIILSPILGGVIGYITNYIAIKMLFHPRKAVYIGKKKLPLTPGIIPAQKEKIACSIGNLLSTKLLNSDTIEKNLLSEESLNRMKDLFYDRVNLLKDNENTVEEALYTWTAKDKLDTWQESFTEKASAGIVNKLIETNFGSVIAKSALKNLSEKLEGTFFKKLINDSFVGSLEKQLSNVINDFTERNAPSILKEEFDKVLNDLRRKKICDIYVQYMDKIPNVVEYIIDIYKRVIRSNLDSILKTLNIEEIVRNKVSSLDEEELETAVISIMKDELRAIVYLGAALGFVMGFINIILILA